MTGQRDIERTLDAWFVDGSSVMPDRLFDAVLDQVQRTPQQPLARLRLRLTDMNPRIRWLTATAAALAAVLVTLTLINRPADREVGASQEVPAGPSASPASALPAALVATWLSAPRESPETNPDVGVTFVLSLRTATWTTGLASGANEFSQISRAAVVDADTLRLTTVDTNGFCENGETGTYGWSVSASGETLELTVEDGDTCDLRASAMPGTYWRSDCPTQGDDCLGTLDPGTHASQFFDPFAAADWVRRYGALSYTVPDGWLNHADWPVSYKLGPIAADAETMIYLASDVVVADDETNCEEVADPDIGTTAAEITAWLTTADGLIASTREPVSIGGLDGFRVDIMIDPDWTETCPYVDDGSPTRHLFTDRPTTSGFDWGIGPDGRMRLYFLDLGDGRALMVDIESLTSAEYDPFVDDATTIVESFTFTP